MRKYYHICWDGYSLEDGLKAGFDVDYSWYAIMIYPKGVLGRMTSEPDVAYIGMSSGLITERLLTNHKGLLSALRDFDGRKVGLALGYCTDEVLDGDEISEIESYLIAYLKPQLNSQHVKDQADYVLKIESETNIDTIEYKRLEFISE